MAVRAESAVTAAHRSIPSRRWLSPASRWTRAVMGVGLSLAIAGPAVLPQRALGEDAAVPEVESASRSVEAKLGVNALIFSGPGTNYYPTIRLPEGTSIIVVGQKKEWLKILPPEGSFSYVLKAFVHASGTGSQGKGTVNQQCIVKAGSSMQPAKWAVQTKLEPGDAVTIVGEDNEYFKIKPPEGTFLYINKDAVPFSSAKPIARAGQPANPPAPPTLPHVPEGGPVAQAGGNDLPPASDPRTPVSGPLVTSPPTAPVAPTTRDAVAAGNDAGPSTQPSSTDLLAQLQKLEGEFSEMSKQPLLEQPVGDMLEKYQAIASTPGLPDVAKRVADVRVTTLKVRSEAKAQFEDVQKKQQELAERLKVQQAEKEEIQQRMKETDIQVYAAVGTLRTSSLQISKTPLYRLTDPQTGRTVVYVWATDPKVPELINQFIGIKGPLQTDPRLNLKVVTPTAADVVDPAKVNGDVAAEIVPPSLLPKAGAPAQAGTASTGNQ